MKKTPLFLVLALFGLVARAQQETESNPAHVAVKWAPTGLLVGSLSLQGEYNFGGRNSLTAKIGLPVNGKYNFDHNGETLGFNAKATSFLAGYRTYFSRTKHLRGLYFEPFFKYVNHTAEGSGRLTPGSRKTLFNLMNNYSAAGVGVQLGTQFFIGKRIVVDLFFLGLEINSATNTLKAVDISDSQPWTDAEARESAASVRDFLDRFPFIGNRTKVMADKDLKRVRAAFKGALPGVRTGFSIGVAF